MRSNRPDRRGAPGSGAAPRRIRVAAAVIAPLLAAALAAAAGEPPRPATDEERQLFLSHLRGAFDDIHDVSMRFHAVDPGIAGTIALAMVWEDGRLVSGEVESNDTGNEEEPLALLDAIGGWRIEGLDGPCRVVIPFRIRIVGSDAPDFAERGILTGTVRAADGAPVASATVAFSPSAGSASPPNPARSNREGVYIRTLIPPGTWDLTCAAEGHAPSVHRGVTFAAGEHRVVDFILGPEGEGAD